MPYKIEKQPSGGFKVCDTNRCFSNKPLTKKQATKQRIAIALSESRITNKPISTYFK
jgi:hypothetical protein